MSRPTRRSLLRGSSAALATAAVAPYSSAGKALRPGGNEMLKVGLVGCGGRGTGAAANALRADPNVKLWAMADAFADQLEGSLRSLQGAADVADKIDVPPERRFVGFEGYRGVIETCDVVCLATSPHFRPLHVEAAVAAGKHLFVEKPVATDAPGVRRIAAACEEGAKKGLSIVSGLCYRYENAKRETVARLQDGAVGDVVALQTSYNTGGLWHRGDKESWSRMEYQMRNWLYFTWLSGDHIAEQHIHSLDKIAWLMGGPPEKVTASGGRIVRTDPKYGNIFDHFNSVFEFPGGIPAFSSCRQWVGAKSDVSDWVFGTRGRANIQRHLIEAGGGWKWRWRGEGPDDMYQNEHDALFAAIRAGEPINNGKYMCESTLMAIMARMSAYTGQAITWEQAWNSTEDLSPAAYAWTDDVPRVEIAQPGVTQFV